MIDLSRSRWLNNWNNSSNWIYIQVSFEVMLQSNIRHEKVFHVLIFYVRLVPAEQISNMCQLFIILRYETKFYDWHFSFFIVFAIDVILYAYEESIFPFQELTVSTCVLRMQGRCTAAKLCAQMALAVLPLLQ
jgi:hypothetical protein